MTDPPSAGRFATWTVRGNTYGNLLIVSQHKVRINVADALCPTATLTVGGSWDKDALLNRNGFDQTRSQRKTNLYANPGYRAVTSAAPVWLPQPDVNARPQRTPEPTAPCALSARHRLDRSAVIRLYRIPHPPENAACTSYPSSARRA